MERAMLELVGIHGYGQVTVAAVLARSGANRTQFYAAFTGKEDCFASAYETATESLVVELLAPCGEDVPWAVGIRGALDQLIAFVGAQPDLARGVFIAAGPPKDERITAKRREVVGRLTHAVDRARREIPDSRHAPPPLTARFIVSGIEAAVVKFLREPDDFPDPAEELLALVLVYFPKP
jgi:AcrR family transcriptional regulator